MPHILVWWGDRSTLSSLFYVSFYFAYTNLNFCGLRVGGTTISFSIAEPCVTFSILVYMSYVSIPSSPAVPPFWK